MHLKMVNIGGKEYPACFSTRVMMDLEDKGGTIQSALTAIAESEKVSDLFHLLHQMLLAGYRYSERQGLPHSGELSFDELIDSVGIDDYKSVFSEVMSIVRVSSETTVEATAPKNAETRQAVE